MTYIVNAEGTVVLQLREELWEIGCRLVLEDIIAERRRQVAQYGHNEDTPDGTGPETRWLGPFTGLPAHLIQEVLREDYEDYEEEAPVTWVHLIREEIAEAFETSDPDRLYAEVTQVAALCVSWLERQRARR